MSGGAAGQHGCLVIRTHPSQDEQQPGDSDSGTGRQITRRVAEAVADLHARVGDLTAQEVGRNRRVPPLRELLAARDEQRARAAGE